MLDISLQARVNIHNRFLALLALLSLIAFVLLKFYRSFEPLLPFRCLKVLKLARALLLVANRATNSALSGFLACRLLQLDRSFHLVV